MTPVRETVTNFWRDELGAAAIEFAMVALVFFSLIFGIIVYGGYFAALSAVHYIAYECARATLPGLDDDERRALAMTRAEALETTLSGLLGGAAPEVEAATSGAGLFAVTVRHTYDSFGLMGFSPFLPLPPSGIAATVEISHGGY